MRNADLLRPYGHLNQRAKLFVEFFMYKNYEGTTLEEALCVYAEFHILEGKSVEWNKEHSFDCNCTDLYQRASCHHGLLCTMCKPSLVVSQQPLWLGLHWSGKRGRPSRGDRRRRKEEFVGSHDRVQQTKGYPVPMTTAQLETVESEDNAQPAPRAPNKVRTCRAAGAVWCL